MWLNQPSESLQKEKDSQKLWGPGDLKGPFLSIVTPIEEKMQITPKLLTLVKIFDSLNHSFNFYWQNNDSKNIHSKKNLIIHSSKIFIKKKKLFIQKKIHSKKSWAFIQKKYSFKSFFDYSFNENIHFFEKMPYRPPLVSRRCVRKTYCEDDIWSGWPAALGHLSGVCLPGQIVARP